ncbi:MAG: TolC family protein [Rhodanobacteraceae bacterium]
MRLRPARLLCLFISLATALLAGCATYRPLPLDNGRRPQRLKDLTVPAASMPTQALRTYRFDPSDGLDVTETAMLAIANNPQLKVERDAAGVAHAQAYAAGLLPDPQLSYEHDRPTSNQPDTTDSYTAGLSLDLGNLITRSARVASARAGARKVDLDLLWGEWQTIAQARTLFDQVDYLRQRAVRLQREQAALRPIHASIEQALRAGDLTYDSASAGLNAASDVSNQLAGDERHLHLAEHDLHDLLGLDAGVPLHLTGAPFSVNPSAGQVQRALADMAMRRPDLLALRAGYRAQQEKLRAAILAQFPAITVGFVKARDNSNISSEGFSIGLSLPLFDGNRGNIAIERATRQQLHDEYSARLLTSRNDIQRLLADLASDRAQIKELAAHAAQLAQARQAAASNYAAGRLDWRTYLAIRAGSLSADSTLLTLEQNTHVTAIALDAMVGNWPDVANKKRTLMSTSLHIAPHRYPGIGGGPVSFPPMGLDPGQSTTGTTSRSSR